jgi:hypothetical protein
LLLFVLDFMRTDYNDRSAFFDCFHRPRKTK